MVETQLHRREGRRSVALSYLINNLFEAENLDECLDIAIKGLAMLKKFQCQIALLEDGCFVVKRNHMDRKIQLLLEKVSGQKFIGHRVDTRAPFASHLANSRTIATADLEETTRVRLEDVIREYLPGEMDLENRFSIAKRVVSLVSKDVDLVMMPINYQGRVIGAVGISGTSIQHDDVLFMQNLCELFAQSFEKTQINEALKKSEEEYRSLVEESLQGIVIAQGFPLHIIFANPAATNIIGYTVDEISTLSPEETMKMIHPEDRGFVTERYKNRMEGEDMPPQYELRLIHKDKKERWVEILTKRIEYQGKPAVQVALIDITDRKRMAEDLRRYSEYLENIYDASPDAITTTDLNGNMVECNQATLDMHGYSSKEELNGNSAFILIARKDHERAMENMKKTFEEGSIRNIEYTFLSKDGREFPAELSASVIKDSSGTPTGFIAITKDITQRKMMEEELRENEEKFRILAEQSPNMIFINKKGKIVYVNARCVEIIGYKKQDFYSPDFDFLELISQESLGRVKESFKRHMKGEEVPPYEYTMVTRDGKKIEAILTTKLIRYEGEVAILGTITDITERKRMEDELKLYSSLLEEMVWEKTKQLKEAERMATIGEIAAMVGHDLRNPLQVLINLHYLARKSLDSIPTPIRKYLVEHGLEEMMEMSKGQVDYMNKIVSDLQDYARNIEPKLAPTSLHQLINETLSTMTVPKNVDVSITISENTPKVMVDPTLMKRVFVNLITNAMQAMPKGGRLKIRTSKTKDAVSISVEDTGVGIPKENLDKIFSPLFTTKSKGQGFGLAVANRMVEIHGGSISVKSKVDRGSTFIVKIPYNGKVT